MAPLANINYNVCYGIQLFIKKGNEFFLVRKETPMSSSFFIQCHSDNCYVYTKKSTSGAVKTVI